MKYDNDWKLLAPVCAALMGMLIWAAAIGQSYGGEVYSAAKLAFPIEPPPDALAIPEQAYKDSGTAQEWAAWAALAGVGVGLLTIAILFWTLFTTRDLLEEARRTTKAAEDSVQAALKIGQAQVRCYISFDTLDFSWRNGLFDPEFVIQWHNAGNSPALAPEVTILVRISEYDSSTGATLSREEKFSFPFISTPSQSQSRSCRLHFDEQKLHPQTAYRDLSHFELKFEVCVFAKDVFDKTNQSVGSLYAEAHTTNARINSENIVDTSGSISEVEALEIISRHRGFSKRYPTKAEA